MMYNGVDGVYTYTFQYDKKETCPVCGTTETTLEISPELKLEEFVELLTNDSRYQLKRPSIRAPGKSLYMQAPPALEEATRKNLGRQMKEMIEEGDSLDITDPSLPFMAIAIRIKWSQH